MSTLQDFKHGLSRAWETVADGWRDLAARAGDALTHFNPVHRRDNDDARDVQLMAASSRWGVLPAELRVGDEQVELTLEVPGMHEDDFTIDVLDDMLIVRGEKRIEQERSSGRFHVMERAYGSFERALRLPVAVDEHGGKASYRRGVLHITLPRAAHTRSRKIPVKSA